MDKITIVDIEHKAFKKVLTGYAAGEVDQFLDEIIETLEDHASSRSALEAEVADLKDRISHFKSMEESLRNTLLLAQRTADEVKASAHKEADLIKAEARMMAEKEIGAYRERSDEARREAQRTLESTEKAKSELHSFLMTHLALLERTVPAGASSPPGKALPAPEAQVAIPAPNNGSLPPLADLL